MKPVLLLVMMAAVGLAAAEPRAEVRTSLDQTNRISNFRTEEISPAELRVTVDYVYSGAFGTTGVDIHAAPDEPGGVFDPRVVEFDEIPLKVGAHTESFRITKRAEARDFTSVTIRVCMATPERAFLCEDFPYIKTWTAAGPPRILSLSATSPIVRRGAQTTLTWNVADADQVLLDGAAVPANGLMVVTLNTSTTYTLRATNRAASAERTLTVAVSGFEAPTLGRGVDALELCKAVDESGPVFRCISPDGPFAAGDEIHVILRFGELPRGDHQLGRTLSSSGPVGKEPWTIVHQESSTFANPQDGPVDITFAIPNVPRAVQWLDVVLNDRADDKSSILFCVECANRMREWSSESAVHLNRAMLFAWAVALLYNDPLPSGRHHLPDW